MAVSMNWGPFCRCPWNKSLAIWGQLGPLSFWKIPNGFWAARNFRVAEPRGVNEVNQRHCRLAVTTKPKPSIFVGSLFPCRAFQIRTCTHHGFGGHVHEGSFFEAEFSEQSSYDLFPPLGVIKLSGPVTTRL